MHHRGYLQCGTSTIWTLVHVWFGRIIIIFAIINGGLGIQYAANSVQAEKGYGVVAGVFGLAYISVLVWRYMKGNKQMELGKSDGSVVVERSMQLKSDNQPPSKEKTTIVVNKV
jgi:hypothetical protein